MPITLDLSPAIEARLIQQAEQQGVPVSRYIENLLETPLRQVSPSQKDGADAYIARVHQVLKKLDELPRLARAHADEISGFDEWGLPAR